MSAQAIVTSQRDYAIDLLGPTRSDTGWQAREGQGFSLDDFVIDWEALFGSNPMHTLQSTPAWDHRPPSSTSPCLAQGS
jgi:hypothetical protein